MRKLFSLGTAFLCLSALALAQVRQETEPNDERRQAQEVRLGDTVEGGFQQNNDDDWYKFNVDQPGKNYVRIDLSAVPEIDTRMYLLDANGGTLLGVNDAKKNEVESIAFVAVEPGTYFVHVFGAGKATGERYSLSLKLDGPWQEGQEFEPNDRREQANDLSLGKSIEGHFQRTGDNDYFRLLVDKPGKHDIQVDLSALPDYNQQFVIQDKDGKELWSAKGRPKGEPESVAYFTVTEGVYYIWVRGSQKQIADKYTLSTRILGPWREDEEAEPNDEMKWASGLKLGTPLTGRTNRDNDRDYYVFKVPEPGAELLVFEVSGIAGETLNLELFDPAGKRLDRSVEAEVGEDLEIPRMEVKPGTYYLRIDPPAKNKVGSEYTLYVGSPRKPPASPEEVRKALVKALDWLVSGQEKDGSWSGHREAYAGLSLMAFIGSKCTQKDYAAPIASAVRYLKSTWKPSAKYPEGSKEAATMGGRLGSANMYEQAIAAMALIEALVDLNDDSLEPIIQDTLNLILRSQNTEHKPTTLAGPVQPDSPFYGGWRYNPYNIDSDLSVTAWQILTLKAAVNAGFTVPDHVFPAAAGYVRSLQGKDDGSFEYQKPGKAGDSCCRAGMGALALQLCGFPQDPAVPPALRFMKDHAPRWNIEYPGEGYAFYYWYYGTRAMYASGGDDWRVWKDWMCRFLVDHQNPDGSWDGRKSEKTLDTYRVAFGALMLEFCCGHVPIYMSPVKRSGPGTLKVVLEKGAEKEAGKAVEIIMDASNSMTGMVGKETKIATARRVLTQTINGLSDSMSIGFRVYGHRFATDDYDNACRDTELLVPIGPVKKAALVEMVNKIQTKGRTPLVLSVLAAIKDFEKIPNGSVILVTDGIESCKGDIQSIAPAIKKAGLAIEVNIVGFDIKEAAARQELQSIAASTGGRYLDAKDAGELLSALEQTLKLEYVVFDDKGEEAGPGIVGGDEIKLAAGDYTIRVLVTPQPVEFKVTVKSGVSATYMLKKTPSGWILN